MAVEDGKRAPFVIEWRDGFKINIDQVDDEHRRLFQLVKALDLDTVEQTLEELLEYVVTHFTNEQALMERSGYPASTIISSCTRNSATTSPISWRAATRGRKRGCRSCAGFSTSG